MAKNLQPFSGKSENPLGSYYLLYWGMIFFFVILGMRLWYLQVIKGDELRNKSETNRTVVVELNPVRGQIMDRAGNILVDNQISFDLCLQKSEIRDEKSLLTELADIFKLSLSELATRYAELPEDRKSVSTFISNLTRDQLVDIENRRWRLSGVSVKVNQTRMPKSDLLASHILGYLGEVSRNQLDSERRRIDEGIRRLVLEGELRAEARQDMEREVKPHRAGDLVGQSGVEQSMEKDLQGRRGVSKREVDSSRRLVREMEIVNPEPGHNIRLTLDSRLQAMAQSLLGQRAGAIVVMDPRTFEVLALGSSPTYSLNDFSGGISLEKWNALRNDEFHPMNNRAVAGQYPPGSTFKIVVALAALAERIITPETEFHCSGSLQLGNHTFGCHSRYGHGPVNLKKSLKVSCDVYYYEVGRRMGVDRLAKKSREFFNLGRKVGIDLPTESAGLIPDSAWKLRRFNQRWSPGETLPVSIGQGFVLCSPLQVAMFTAAVANGGNFYRPHLVREIVDVDGQVVKRFEPELISRIDVGPEQLRAVQEGLEAVVNEEGGSGRRAALPDMHVSGKTGTSQVVSLKRYQGFKREELPYKYRDHAWFTSYAPSDKPEVVVTVLLEHTGGGGTYAAPIARRMLEAYFDKTIVAESLPPPQIQPDLAAGLVRGEPQP